MLIFCTYHSSLTPLLQFYWTKGPLRVLTNLSNFWILSIQGRPLTVFCEYVQRLALLKQLYLTDQWKQFIVNKLQKQLSFISWSLPFYSLHVQQIKGGCFNSTAHNLILLLALLFCQNQNLSLPFSWRHPYHPQRFQTQHVCHPAT